ncbi:alanine--tRNA ligase [Campylobacterota bacterium]|nr:alanine--tRNA ligase [Campylobacterota bacterium]
MDIRKAYLDYFTSKKHAPLPSSPLVPNDASLLFTNAGMVQFKPIFTGETPPLNPPRATTSQTCIRAGGKHNDLENVGYTARHHTFFEMLGNFSFGDYFKEEAIGFAWEFLTATLALPAEKLYISVHESDDEAEAIWLGFVPKERIKRFGDKDNFWQMGETGPCGPCSEIYYDQGAEHFATSEDYFGGDGDRFLEVWNLVFMQYNRDEKGVLHPLPKPSIDTGMGLERITAIKEGALSNYDSSLFKPLLAAIAQITQKPYDPQHGSSHRVIADHLRAVTFLLSQGVNFDKDGRGYVLRRILRRAVRHGYLLGQKEPFLHKLAPVLVEQMKSAYPYLEARQGAVVEQICEEEARFFATITSGMRLFTDELAKSPTVFSGESAFKLYDTFGFPLDLTQDMLRSHNIKLDIDGFDRAMQKQKAAAKSAWKGSGDSVAQGDFRALLEEFGANVFVGYDRTIGEAKAIALLDENYKRIDELRSGETGFVLLDQTPFYATGGGQKGDSGELLRDGEPIAIVLQTDKFFGLNLSKITARRQLSTGENLTAAVGEARAQTARHHSAAHLLHSALGEILGENATQAGSEVSADRLRFDFNYPKQVGKEQLELIEARVNQLISQSIAGETRVLPIAEAKELGAKALFGEKYGDLVRVVSFGGVSTEFCGGTHVANTAQIGVFAIVKESGVSAGVRRIEAVASSAAYTYFAKFRESYESLGEVLKGGDLLGAVAKLQATIKEQKQTIEKLQSGGENQLKTEDFGGVKTAIALIDAGDAKMIVDDFKNRYERAAVMVFAKSGANYSVVAGVKNAPISAAEWIKAIGAKGGGRGDFASGGGIGDFEAAKLLAEDFAKEKLTK